MGFSSSTCRGPSIRCSICVNIIVGSGVYGGGMTDVVFLASSSSLHGGRAVNKKEKAATMALRQTLTRVELNKIQKSLGITLYAAFVGQMVIIEMIREQVVCGRLVFVDENNNCILEDTSNDPLASNGDLTLYIPGKESANSFQFRKIPLKSLFVKGTKIRFIQLLLDVLNGPNGLESALGKCVSRGQNGSIVSCL